MDGNEHADFEHTGPSTPAGRLLRRAWHPVFVSEDLKTSYAMPLMIMKQELTLYRGEDGVARIIDGRCPHRGLLLSVGQIEGNCVRCRYHGWKFDGTDVSGAAVRAQNSRRGSRSPAIRSRSSFGSFGFISAASAPPLPRWPDLESSATSTSWAAVELLHDLENTVDDVHQMWVHRKGSTRTPATPARFPK